MKVNKRVLINAMLDKGMNNKKLSEAAGVSLSRISNIKNGQSTAYETLCKVAKALELSPRELIDFEESEV